MSGFTFEGFEPSNTTPVPDVLFDVLLTHLNEAQLKALMYIIRRTLGFKKTSDTISLKQFRWGITTKKGEQLDQGCGLKNFTTIVKALSSLEQMGCIESEKRETAEGDQDITVYRIKFRGTTQNGVGVLRKTQDGTPQDGVGVLRKTYPQETVLQQTDIQYRNSMIKMQRNVSNKQQGYQSFQTIGSLLKQKTKQQEREVQHLPESIEASIDEISTEFNDASKRRSNRTRVLHIYQVSGKTEERFTSYLYEARSITKQQGSVKNKMPYFFRVLEDITGVQKRDRDTLSDASTTPQNGSTTNFFTGNG